MKTIIIVHSYHHHNTLKVAKKMGDALDAKIVKATQTSANDLADYDLIGLGAGIDSGHHYDPLLNFARGLPNNDGTKKCFVFSTSAIYSQDKMQKDHGALNAILGAKAYPICGQFSCKGFNTNSFLKLFGGMNKNYPIQADLNDAHSFALGLA